MCYIQYQYYDITLFGVRTKEISMIKVRIESVIFRLFLICLVCWYCVQLIRSLLVMVEKRMLYQDLVREYYYKLRISHYCLYLQTKHIFLCSFSFVLCRSTYSSKYVILMSMHVSCDCNICFIVRLTTVNNNVNNK